MGCGTCSRTPRLAAPAASSSRGCTASAPRKRCSPAPACRTLHPARCAWHAPCTHLHAPCTHPARTLHALYNQACDRLVETVLRSAKCTDNVSVVLVMLDWLPDGE
eukprot:scaffold58734_cov65-Phaeocystis_antarctica.AAC.2